MQAIAGGQNHTCALVNGGARCWGWNEDGQLGDGNFGPGSPIAVQVQGLWSGVQAITGGTYHTCALSNGSALCWGRNSRGQLGDGSFASSAVPVQVSGLWDGAVAIAPGYEHTCALANGAVLCWGINERGQLGNGDGADRPEPVPVAGLSNHLAKVDGGFMHTCALVNGGVQCWGSNSHGQLGDGGASGAYSPVPVPVSGLSRGVQAVSAGVYHTCAIVNGGAVCWGDNLYGQLGNGSPGSSSSQTGPGPGPLERRPGHLGRAVPYLRDRRWPRVLLGRRWLRPARRRLGHEQLRAGPGVQAGFRGAGHLRRRVAHVCRPERRRFVLGQR